MRNLADANEAPITIYCLFFLGLGVFEDNAFKLLISKKFNRVSFHDDFEIRKVFKTIDEDIIREEAVK